MSARRARKVSRSRTARRKAEYVLRLYVTGTTAKSIHAIQNVRRICEEYLQGAYDLEVIEAPVKARRAVAKTRGGRKLSRGALFLGLGLFLWGAGRYLLDARTDARAE